MLSAFCHAQEVDSMRSVSLDSVVVSARRNTSGMAQRADGTLVWKMQNLLDMPKILGNADPIHFAQMLPGIQTNTEFRCGINIEGCDNTHNVVEIGGVPVYNASHLLGFFSVFNASHYQAMNVAKTPLNAANAARIGGTLSFEPFYVAPDSTHGEASVGLISSQATVRTRLGSRTHCTFSLRASYLNLLYGRWLRADNNDINYFFYDANLTLVHRFSDTDALAFDAYAGTDNAKITESGYLATMMARWGNVMGALHWLHDNGCLHMRHTVYATAYSNRFRLEMQEMKAKLPSAIADVGYRADLRWRQWKTGGAFAVHRVQPQAAESYGDYGLNVSSQKRRTAVEGAVYVDTPCRWAHASAWMQASEARCSEAAVARLRLPTPLSSCTTTTTVASGCVPATSCAISICTLRASPMPDCPPTSGCLPMPTTVHSGHMVPRSAVRFPQPTGVGSSLPTSSIADCTTRRSMPAIYLTWLPPTTTSTRHCCAAMARTTARA